jgi:hypothetical protein
MVGSTWLGCGRDDLLATLYTSLYPKFHRVIGDSIRHPQSILRIFAKLQIFLLSGRKSEPGIRIAVSVS